jgi:outer membrane lipoprotein-sorting protein
LIDAGSVPGSNPLLAGASGRLWWSADNGLRLELQSDNGDEQIVVNKQSFWVYDSSSNTVYKGDLPAKTATSGNAPDKSQPPSLTQIENGLKQLAQHVNVSGAVPSNVGGQPAYSVSVSPKHDGGLVGSVETAWDAARGVPLKAAIYAKGDSAPVIELRADNVTYGDVPAAAFDVQPPAAAKVVDVSVPSAPAHQGDAVKPAKPVTGLGVVESAVDFKLSAPDTLAGQARNEVRLIDWKGKQAAVVTYGRGLGGIAVIERPAPAGKPNVGATAPTGGHGDRGFKLPTVDVNGVQAQTLGTALGSVVNFERGGVSYTVVGSVTQAQAETAARGL